MRFVDETCIIVLPSQVLFESHMPLRPHVNLKETVAQSDIPAKVPDTSTTEAPVTLGSAAGLLATIKACCIVPHMPDNNIAGWEGVGIAPGRGVVAQGPWCVEFGASFET